MIISLNERLSHFIMRKNEVRPSDQTVKFRAFMPPKSKRLSVYRTSTLSEDKSGQLGTSLSLDRKVSPFMVERTFLQEMLTR